MCKHPTCENGICRRPKKEKKKPQLIPKVSKKQASLNRKYSALTKKGIDEVIMCEMRSPVCTGKAQGKQHIKGRGIHLLNKEKLIDACNSCNLYAEINPEWARENGFAEKRNYAIERPLLTNPL